MPAATELRVATHLRVVRTDAPPAGDAAAPAGRASASGGAGDLALIAVLFLLNLLPVAGELVHAGRWSPAIVGFAAGAALLTGRELWFQLRARARARADGGGAP